MTPSAAPMLSAPEDCPTLTKMSVSSRLRNRPFIGQICSPELTLPKYKPRSDPFSLLPRCLPSFIRSQLLLSLSLPSLISSCTKTQKDSHARQSLRVQRHKPSSPNGHFSSITVFSRHFLDALDRVRAGNHSRDAKNAAHGGCLHRS